MTQKNMNTLTEWTENNDYYTFIGWIRDKKELTSYVLNVILHWFERERVILLTECIEKQFTDWCKKYKIPYSIVERAEEGVYVAYE